MHDIWSPRWMIVGRFGNPSSGKSIQLTGSGLSRTMASIAPEFHIHHPTLVHTGFSEGIHIKFSRPREFGWNHLPKKINLWSSLLEVANDLEKGRLTPTEAWGHIGRLMGATPWWNEIQKSSQNPDIALTSETTMDVSTSSQKSGELGNFSGVDSLFSKVSWPSRRTESQNDSRKALDDFVRAISGGTVQDEAATRKDLVQRIRDLVGEGAAAIWTDPNVEQSQALWKGLHFLIGNNSGQQSATIELFDASTIQAVNFFDDEKGNLPQRGRLPDCIFFTEEPEFCDFGRILDFADRAQVPVIFPVDSWLRLDERARLCGELRKDRRLEDWQALRKHSGAEWACAVANPFVVSHEQHQEMSHTVFASATMAMAAMLSASYVQTGGFAHFGDRQVPIVLPATWFHREPQSDSFEERATRALLDNSVQSELGKLGIVSIGNRQRVTEIRANGNICLRGDRAGFGIGPKIFVGKIIRCISESLQEISPNLMADAICHHCRMEVERNLTLAHPIRLELSIENSNEKNTTMHGAIDFPECLVGAPIRSEFHLPISQ